MRKLSPQKTPDHVYFGKYTRSGVCYKCHNSLAYLLRHFVFVLKQVVPILVSANISAIQVSLLPVLNHQSKLRKFT